MCVWGRGGRGRTSDRVSLPPGTNRAWRASAARAPAHLRRTSGRAAAYSYPYPNGIFEWELTFIFAFVAIEYGRIFLGPA